MMTILNQTNIYNIFETDNLKTGHVGQKSCDLKQRAIGKALLKTMLIKKGMSIRHDRLLLYNLAFLAEQLKQ